MGLSLKLRAVLWVHNLRSKLDLQQTTPEAFRQHNRQQLKSMSLLIAYKSEQMHTVTDIQVGTSKGAFCIRAYRPSEEVDLPVVVYFHGGGFVVGDLETHDNLCRRIAKQVGAVVVAVDYPRAPEYKFPVIPHICYEITQWIANNAHTFGGDATRLAVMGDSAGGNLATGVCMQAHQQGSPKILQQILIYPCTDATFSGKTTQTRAEGYILTTEMMKWFLQHYITPETDLKDPLLSPLWATEEQLSPLPPAIVVTAGYDPLCSEGASYAEKLKMVGVKVMHQHYENMVHVFFQMPRLLQAGKEAQKSVCQSLRTTFGMNGRL